MNHNDSICLMSVDGTDFRIQNQYPFWSGWFSFKFNGPGLRYEIGLCIQTGWIVWVNGPFAPGPWPDINIFRGWLKRHLAVGECVEADQGYRGDPQVHCPLDHCDHLFQWESKFDVRARHETVNRRIKDFHVMKNQFRHDIEKHVHCFNAVAVITQLNIQSFEPLYQVEYRTHME